MKDLKLTYKKPFMIVEMGSIDLGHAFVEKVRTIYPWANCEFVFENLTEKHEIEDDLSISVKEMEGESLSDLKKRATDEFNKKMNDFFEPYLKNYEDDVLWTLSHPDADEKRKLL